jgi:hypothetical protein
MFSVTAASVASTTASSRSSATPQRGRKVRSGDSVVTPWPPNIAVLIRAPSKSRKIVCWPAFEVPAG